MLIKLEESLKGSHNIANLNKGTEEEIALGLNYIFKLFFFFRFVYLEVIYNEKGRDVPGSLPRQM